MGNELPVWNRPCQAHNGRGEPCGASAIRGGTVCQAHGGSAPAVRRRAQLRLLELVDPAVAVLARLIADANTPPAIRLKAATEVLDRCGFPAGLTITPDDSRELLKQRILQQLAARDQTGADDVDHEIVTVEGEDVR